MFGTDGIRGAVGSPWVNEGFFQRLAWLMTKRDVFFTQQRLAILACDTRASGTALKHALACGFRAGGVDVIDLGVLPTPILSYVMQAFPASVGVMVTASHNPYTDNGLKIFQADGSKLPAKLQLLIADDCKVHAYADVPDQLSGDFQVQDGLSAYVQHCVDAYAERLQPLSSDFHMVVDAAHGANYVLAPQLLSQLSLSYTMIGASPNGMNINQGCGSTDLSALRQAVLDQGADLGVAFDGDGDRVLMVDHRGECIDGDHMLFGLVKYHQHLGEKVPGVVGTLMSNHGLSEALAAMGVPFERTQVGDSHVLSMLHQHQWRFGAEPSGHVIDLDFARTGDGMTSALQWLAWMASSGMRANALRAMLTTYPQVLVNVPVDRFFDVSASPSVAELLAQYQAQLADQGRILLRPSGTEPLLRVMVEGRDQAQIQHMANQLAACIRDEHASAVAAHLRDKKTA